ncbi:hypothetical protein ART_1617 [Arthrobacter sp. PAMC 25486]|uniref:hypothetical protein n=1 Tax=Arthrobacter sp. PAMC 25486 TaxID=1494608 RepID=UPI000535FD8E|nr:hypothetical protein [Arthrobacter sp. PAMC 25486]AIY01216.1 hypothetical protein ART_1617 [Arthrobacter sp. PAMC 25486]
MLQNERVYVVDTITGQKMAELAVTDFSYKRVINGMGPGSATVRRGDSRNHGLNVRFYTKPLRYMLVYEANFKPVYAGIITRRKYVKATGELALELKDVWWILGKRMAVEHGTNAAAETILTWSGLSLGTIIKKLIQEAVWPARPWYALPIVFPADVSGVHSRKYYGYNFATIADAISDLMATSGGPNVDFVPSWSGEFLRLTLRTGSLGGNVWEYNLDAPDPGIYDVAATEDAESITTNAYSLGEGSEKNMLVRSHPDLSGSLPAIEKTESHKDISVATQLDALAQERIRTQAVPTEQFEASIRKDGEPGPNGEQVIGLPTVDQLRLGDTILTLNDTDEFLPTGATSHQIIEFSGSMGDPMVTLQFQPTGA